MTDGSWNAAPGIPGIMPESEASERVPTPKLEVDVRAEGGYEAFLNDQLDALKRQLLAYHNQQPLHEQNGPRATAVVQVQPRQSASQAVAIEKSKVKPWTSSLVVDIIKEAPNIGDGHHHRASRASLGGEAADHATLVMAKKFSTSVHGSRHAANPTWTKFAIRENNLFRLIWSQAVVGFLILYVATVFPYKLAFLDFRIGSTDEEELEWQIIQWIVDICFWADLGVSFFLTYRNDEDFEVCDIRLIARKYLTGMFFIDFLACAPSEFFQTIIFQSDEASRASPTRAINLTKLQRLTRLLRILRLRQISKFAEIEWVQAIARFRGFRMFGLLAGVFWLMHLFGCGWYICGALHENATTESWVARRGLPDGTTLLDKGPGDAWVHSCYFVLTVFTTVGFGDMSAFTVEEIIYVCMLMVVGGVLNGMVLSYVMNILEESDRKDLATQKTINTLKDFADHTQLNSSVMYHITNLARQSRNSAEIDSESVKKVFAGLILPRSAMSDLCPKLWKGKLLKNDFFQKGAHFRQVLDIPPRLVLFVASMLKMRDFHEAGECLYNAGDMPMNVFLVLVGTFAFLGPVPGDDPAEKAPYQLFGTRSFFGECEILNGIDSRVTTARCEAAGSICLLLAKQDILNLCDDFPAFGNSLRILSARRESSRKRRLAKLSAPRTYEQIAFQAICRWMRKYQGVRGRGKSGNLVTVVPRAS